MESMQACSCHESLSEWFNYSPDHYSQDYSQDQSIENTPLYTNGHFGSRTVYNESGAIQCVCKIPCIPNSICTAGDSHVAAPDHGNDNSHTGDIRFTHTCHTS